LRDDFARGFVVAVLMAGPDSQRVLPVFLQVLVLWLVVMVPAQAGAISLVVSLPGLPADLERNVRLFLSIEQQKDHELLEEGRLRRLHKKAEGEIKRALQPFGFYRPTVVGRLSRIDAISWSAEYRIDLGPPLTIGEFDLQVNPELEDDPQFGEFLASLPLARGDTLNHSHYEAIKAGFLRLAAERGYFEARFVRNRIEVDLNAYSARVLLEFDSGPRYRFGPVRFAQNVLKPDLMQRYVDFDQGDPYQSSSLISLRQALTDSDFFQTVEVAPGEPDRVNHEVPVEIVVTPRKPNRYTLGLGYGTDTGARGSLGWARPVINRSGHSFRSELNLSEIGNSLSAHYSVPVLNPRTDRITYSAGVINEETDSSDSRIQTVGVSLDRGRGQWRESLSLDYQSERYQVADIEDQSNLLIPGVSWSRTWGGDLIFALNGLRFDLNIQGARKAWLSDADFIQMQGGIKFIKNLSQGNRLLARGRMGSTWTRDFDRLPSSVRFFTGGAQSVRGYAYQSLGPKDEDGDVEGGEHLMVGSLELDHRIEGNWGVAVFVDGGNAINSLGDDLKRSVGFGVRWHSPVGPVRIDLASAISLSGDPWRLHINIGPDL
jgi:translocation and assembly module TamA